MEKWELSWWEYKFDFPQYRASKVVLVVKNPPASAGDTRDLGSIPGLGRSPGVGNGNPLQCSYLENSMDRGAWPMGYGESNTLSN